MNQKDGEKTVLRIDSIKVFQSRYSDKDITRNKWNEIWEKVVEKIFFISALMAIRSVAIITFFIFAKGVPAIFEFFL